MDQYLKIRHSGAIGDLIYSLPYVKSLGKKVDFYVGEHSFVTGKANKDTPANLCKMIKGLYPLSNTIYEKNHSNFKALKRLLENQHYIHAAYPDQDDQKYKIDLNDFRKSWSDNMSILEIVNKHFKWYGYTKDEPFLRADKLEGFEDTCLCFRSPRYVTDSGITRYRKLIEHIKKETNVQKFLFVGIDKEYEYFIKNIYEIDRYKTEDMFDVATIINSAPIGIYNCSSPLAIAVGLSKPRYIESPQSHTIFSVKLDSMMEKFF